MKIYKNMFPGPASAPLSPKLRLLVPTVLFALILSAAHVIALPVITTLTGGPSQANPKFFGYADGNTKDLAQFHTPVGVALDSSGTFLVVADQDNNAIRLLDLPGNQTSTFSISETNLLDHPVGVAVDVFNDVFVLNRGNGTDGSLVVFDNFGDLLVVLAEGLVNANGIALDGSLNSYITVNNDTVLQIAPNGAQTTFATIPSDANGDPELRGIAVMASGVLAVTDAGRQGVLLINPTTLAVSNLSGFHGVGDHFGSRSVSKFSHPYGIAESSDGVLVVADTGNHRVKVVDPFGTVTNLYGVSSNFWVQGSPSQNIFPGWWDGTVCAGDTFGCPEARLPVGVTVASDGTVYTTEDYYHLIRHTTATGLPSQGGTTGTNGVVVAPSITPRSGYYPMGQLITVSSPNPNVHFTMDGSEPTTTSPAVVMNGNIGTIHWFNSTNDLTALRVKAFVGTNSSVTVSGQPVFTDDIGVPPGPSPDGSLFGGIGSTIVVPIISNLRTNDQVRSYQFRVEITPNNGAPMIPAGFTAQDISTNDFVQLVTAAQGGNTTGRISVVSYSIGSTRGLQVSAIGNSGNISYQRFATVGLLRIPIPLDANVGDTYSVVVSFPSATSDGVNAPVTLTPMAAATIVVSDIPYTVGDSASLNGAWYNAGTFGDNDLQNADVNNAFYAAAGLKLPYPYTDVYNAMDAYPPDAPGFVGGDGQIRFLDWNLILLRALRLDLNNWTRAWSAGGNLVNAPVNLTSHSALVKNPRPLVQSPWYRQALLGGISVGNVAAGGIVNVPLYVTLANGSTLAGLQFRAIVTPQNGGPALAQAPTLVIGPGMASPSMQQSSPPNEAAFGWSLGAFSFQSRSSNFLGWLRFTVPANAGSGQAYTVSFANADGSPDIYNQYTFETRSATVMAGASAPPASICSDEWKILFFGSVSAANAADLADPDLDGVPNWMEFLAGTDPTDPNSKLRFSGVDRRTSSGQPQVALHWLTAPGKLYEIQFSTGPTGNSWSVLGTVSGDGTITSYTDNLGSNSTRFYRLRILP